MVATDSIENGIDTVASYFLDLFDEVGLFVVNGRATKVSNGVMRLL